MKPRKILYFEAEPVNRDGRVYVVAYCEGGYREAVGEFKTLKEAESFMMDMMLKNDGAMISQGGAHD